MGSNESPFADSYGNWTRMLGRWFQGQLVFTDRDWRPVWSATDESF